MKTVFLRSIAIAIVTLFSAWMWPVSAQEVLLRQPDQDLVLTENIPLEAQVSPEFVLPEINPFDRFKYRFSRSSIKPVTKPIFVIPKVMPVIDAGSLEGIFETYADQYGVDKNVLKKIAKCESHFNPAAQSKNGLYGGMFQYSASTWTSARRVMGLDGDPNLRFNAEESIKTSAFKIANGGIGAWPHCGKI